MLAILFTFSTTPPLFVMPNTSTATQLPGVIAKSLICAVDLPSFFTPPGFNFPCLAIHPKDPNHENFCIALANYAAELPPSHQPFSWDQDHPFLIAPHGTSLSIYTRSSTDERWKSWATLGVGRTLRPLRNPLHLLEMLAVSIETYNTALASSRKLRCALNRFENPLDPNIHLYYKIQTGPKEFTGLRLNFANTTVETVPDPLNPSKNQSVSKPAHVLAAIYDHQGWFLASTVLSLAQFEHLASTVSPLDQLLTAVQTLIQLQT